MNNQNEYWPEDTDTKFYIYKSTSLSDLLEKIQEKWPGAEMKDITIEAEYIQTDCLGYDLYDPGDYGNFLLITKN